MEELGQRHLYQRIAETPAMQNNFVGNQNHTQDVSLALSGRRSSLLDGQPQGRDIGQEEFPAHKVRRAERRESE